MAGNSNPMVNTSPAMTGALAQNPQHCIQSKHKTELISAIFIIEAGVLWESDRHWKKRKKSPHGDSNQRVAWLQSHTTTLKLREALKKNGLFNDIDQISFNIHPPPPKDDIWKND